MSSCFEVTNSCLLGLGIRYPGPSLATKIRRVCKPSLVGQRVYEKIAQAGVVCRVWKFAVQLALTLRPGFAFADGCIQALAAISTAADI